jgi:hypothetical protein
MDHRMNISTFCTYNLSLMCRTGQLDIKKAPWARTAWLTSSNASPDQLCQPHWHVTNCLLEVYTATCRVKKAAQLLVGMLAGHVLEPGQHSLTKCQQPVGIPCMTCMR